MSAALRYLLAMLLLFALAAIVVVAVIGMADSLYTYPGATCP